ncbi:threonylcarbamoyl-AMP synthase [Patescibacteria group bacterium]|nr:threonylcarbamoyl-AMP synthase [Patescibacteria group bacterium]MBU0879482.1 threonylcarbamoyl-AMP synthase [Patescibacteria group bacterium]MBU0880128.1 threonylcarbamoyl-AMP synthase [Patescibacteria group bacterium]MBU0897550.1 threonylcarbamoyl-AMP synthase [Patescibacteria group bacterium]MBU1062734.1 threonylcarbamoyl-AMP synthase [Patescibacteria group bacterium]
MQIIKVDLDRITQEQIDLIVDYLKRGLVIACPTDTIYGLGCDSRNIKAIKKINKIKEEKGSKPRLILVSNFAMLKKYCFINFKQAEYLKKIWPGPITVILKRRSNLPDELTGGLNSLAARLPDNVFLTKIINKVGFPLVSTSLNKKDKKPLSDVKNLEIYFKYLPDLVIDVGKCAKIKPSRLIDLRDINDIKILRK